MQRTTPYRILSALAVAAILAVPLWSAGKKAAAPAAKKEEGLSAFIAREVRDIAQLVKEGSSINDGNWYAYQLYQVADGLALFASPDSRNWLGMPVADLGMKPERQMHLLVPFSMYKEERTYTAEDGMPVTVHVWRGFSTQGMQAYMRQNPKNPAVCTFMQDHNKREGAAAYFAANPQCPDTGGNGARLTEERQQQRILNDYSTRGWTDIYHNSSFPQDKLDSAKKVFSESQRLLVARLAKQGSPMIQASGYRTWRYEDKQGYEHDYTTDCTLSAVQGGYLLFGCEATDHHIAFPVNDIYKGTELKTPGSWPSERTLNNSNERAESVQYAMVEKDSTFSDRNGNPVKTTIYRNIRDEAYTWYNDEGGEDAFGGSKGANPLKLLKKLPF